MDYLVEGSWYGFNAYDGGYHYFIKKKDVIIYLDTFGDCSAVFDTQKVPDGIVVRESFLKAPGQFLEELLKYVTMHEFIRYSSEQDLKGTFIELEGSKGFALFEKTYE